MRMPGLLGLALQATLAYCAIVLPKVFTTDHGDTPTSVLAVKARAEDFLTKRVGRHELTAPIERALARDALQRAEADARHKDGALLARLRPPERELAVFLAQAQLNKQLAFAIGTTGRSINTRRASLIDKLDMRSVTERARLLTTLPGEGSDQNQGQPQQLRTASAGDRRAG